MIDFEKQVLEVARNHFQNTRSPARIGSSDIAKQLNASPEMVYRAVMLLQQRGSLELDPQLSKPQHRVAVISQVLG